MRLLPAPARRVVRLAKGTYRDSKTKQWRHDVFWRSYAALQGRGLAYFIGNSHARVFRYEKGMIAQVISAATAHNLVKNGSSTKSREKLFEAIKRVDKKRDIAVLVFGEVDCRFHINYQYVKTGVPMNDLIEQTIINYGLVIRELQNMGYDIYVCNVVPASRRENAEFPYYGDLYTRAWITQTFNEQLRRFGPKLIDVYTPAVDREGFIKPEFGLDDVHLNEKIIPHVRKQLEDRFPTWLEA